MQPPLEVIQEIRNCSPNTQKYFEAIHLENERLTRENTELRARINLNSLNSSKPPSSNPFIKPKSLREKTGRKPGGQPGHKGKTLRISAKPDVVIEHEVNTCNHCGADFTQSEAAGYKTRQVIDVEIKTVVIEHRVQIKDCAICGNQTTGEFPQGVDHYVQYGSVFSAIVVYLNKGNYIPYDRLAKVSKDIFGIPISSGTLVNLVHKCGQTLENSMEYIKEQLQKSKVLNFDETGIRIMGKNQWLHTAGNDRFTYVETQAKRGNAATDNIGILPSFQGTAVHDFWKPYYKYTDCSHALCNAHILRELNGIIENTKQTWAEQMKTLLVDIKHSVDAAGGSLPATEAAGYESKYDEILSLGDKENPIDMEAILKKKSRGRVARSKARNLLDRMKLYKKDILRFMDEQEVPFDNNQAERDIRMSKLQQKISGGFRSDSGNKAFGNIRSYISTASKQGYSVFGSLYSAISGNPLFTDK